MGRCPVLQLVICQSDCDLIPRWIHNMVALECGVVGSGSYKQVTEVWPGETTSFLALSGLAVTNSFATQHVLIMVF